MKTTHAIAASVLLALSPLFLHAVDEQKAERRRPDKTDMKKRDVNTASQQRMRERGMRGSGFMMQLLQNPRMSEAVGLTEEQRTQLKTAADAAATERKTLHEKMKKTAMAQAKLLTNSEVDEAAVMAAVEETGAIRTQLAKLEMRGFLNSRKILTGEQRKKIKDMMKHRMEQREKGMRQNPMNRTDDAAERTRKPPKNRDDKAARRMNKSEAPASD